VLAAGDAAAEARAANRGFSTLDPADAEDLAAIAERIIPSGDTPGAREAGVVWFMDSALGDVMADSRVAVLGGLAALNRSAAEAGAPERFASLAGSEQIRLLKAVEGEPFFETVRFMTLAGMFAMPGYGGNRGHVGWTLIGMAHAHGWQPPFGYYDGKAANRSEESS
jgi:gluconate 2-dehydrogenase gamma chain